MATLLTELMNQKSPLPKSISQSYLSHLLSVLESGDNPLTSSSNHSSQADSVELRTQSLSRREKDVLRYLSAGLSNHAIAQAMALELSTVKSHLKHMYHKLNVENRTQAVTRAKEMHLL